MFSRRTGRVFLTWKYQVIMSSQLFEIKLFVHTWSDDKDKLHNRDRNNVGWKWSAPAGRVRIYIRKGVNHTASEVQPISYCQNDRGKDGEITMTLPSHVTSSSFSVEPSPVSFLIQRCGDVSSRMCWAVTNPLDKIIDYEWKIAWRTERQRSGQGSERIRTSWWFCKKIIFILVIASC